EAGRQRQSCGVLPQGGGNHLAQSARRIRAAGDPQENVSTNVTFVTSKCVSALTRNAATAIVGVVMHGSRNIAMITAMAMCRTTTCKGTSMRHSGESAV